MTDTTTGTQPTPTGGTPNGQGQPAPVATPTTGTPAPAQTPAPTPAAPPQPAGQQPVTQPAPAQGTEKTFTQAELNQIINDRLTRERESLTKSFGDKLAEVFGGKAPEGDGKQTSDDVLAQARQIVEQAQTRANTATARSFAASSVRDDRIDTLVGMVDVKAALSNVDVNNPAAVDAAIKAAVDAEAAKFPEWSRAAAPQLPGSSTANPNQPTGDGKRIYSRAELQKMTQHELAAVAADLQLAAREGRIKG